MDDALMPRAKGRVLLAFGAHPDDLDYFAGGTLALFARAGGRVIAILATDGERGGRAAGLGPIRRAEQERSAAALGYAGLEFLGHPDGALPGLAGALETDARRLLLWWLPALVITFDAARPRPPYIHPDHQAVGRAVSAALQNVRIPAALYLFHTRAPNLVVDVSPVWEAKLTALRAHASQAAGDSLPIGLRQLWRHLCRRTGLPLPARRERFRRAA